MTYCEGFLFITLGVMGGCEGDGGLYKIDPDTDSSSRLKGDFSNVTTMTTCDGSLYVTNGRMFGCTGDGGLYKINPESGKISRIGTFDCSNVTTMTSSLHFLRSKARDPQFAETGKNPRVVPAYKHNLYMTSGVMGGCKGKGALLRVNKDTGQYEILNRQAKNATVMCSNNGYLFAIAGHMGGCNGSGIRNHIAVYQDRREFTAQRANDEWDFDSPAKWINATIMVGGREGVFVVTGKMHGNIKGSDTLFYIAR